MTNSLQSLRDLLGKDGAEAGIATVDDHLAMAVRKVLPDLPEEILEKLGQGMRQQILAVFFKESGIAVESVPVTTTVSAGSSASTEVTFASGSLTPS